MSEFYICTYGCNKKYKTELNLLKHVKDVHKINDPILHDKVSILKNKKVSNYTLKKQQEEEIKNMVLQSEKYKKNVENNILAEYEEELRSLNQHKIDLEKEKIEIEKQKLNIQKNINKNSNLCAICLENLINVVLVPCGHMHFCADCIEINKTIHEENIGAKRFICPYCRKDIKDVIKVYG